MTTPVLHALAVGLLLAHVAAQAQTSVTRGVTTGTAAPMPLAAEPMADASVGPTMNLTIGKSTLLRMPSAVTRISLGNPGVADVTLITPTELYLLGKTYGSTRAC